MAPSMHRLCMIPGPIEFDKKVLRQMACEGMSHVDPEFIQVFGECLEMLRKVVVAPAAAQPFILAGSGTLGWDMVGANLIEKDDNALVINTGYFGDSFGECLERFGANVTHLRAKQIGGCPSVTDLNFVLKKTNFKVITITHVDTSTGVLTNIKEVATAIRAAQPKALIVVDGVCATGGEECLMQEWDLDVVLTGSQKCIGVPSGLSLSVVSSRAIAAFDSRRSKSSSFYANWGNWLAIMKNYEGRRPSYFATPAVNHIYALHTALSQLLANGGMVQRFREHRNMSNAVKLAIKALGCTQVPVSDEYAATTMTCVRYPPGVAGPDFLRKVRENGVVLAGGLHKKIKTEYFRIGHMGPSTRRLDHVLKTIKAIEIALQECGHKLPRGAGVQEIEALKKAEPPVPMTPPKCPFEAMQSGCPAPPACQLLTLVALAGAFGLGVLVARRT